MKLSKPKFIGRKEELADLRRFERKGSASLIVVRGRRRIGKSRLIEEFSKGHTLYSFAGLCPSRETTAQSQREAFARQMTTQTGLPTIKSDDWMDLFSLLSERLKAGRIILFFDEISWIGSEDPDFLGKIKHAWDTQFKKNPNLIFVICGSASSWIEKNILSSTGFLGRISYTLSLHEMPLSDCNAFWGAYSESISAYEKLTLLSITGGIPKYLEEINARLSAEENIKNLCFKPGAILVDEFDRIFSDLFLHETSLYQNIVNILVQGSKEANEICDSLRIEQSGRISEYLEELRLAGFVARDYTWDIKTGFDSKLSKYRLSDNYLRFYLRYIQKYRTKIERGGFTVKTLTSLPEWYSILGLQFENMVLNNRSEVHRALGLRSEDIISENPFFQRRTNRIPGCQIDYMIQTKSDCLYVVEIKFSKNPIGSNVIEEVNQKIQRLKRPKGLSVRRAIVHVNGVTDDIVDSEFFSSIIDFSKLLEI